MTPIGPATRIYLAAGVTDLRKGFEGLTDLVQHRLGQDPLSGHLLVFANRTLERPTFSIPIGHGGHRVPVASTIQAKAISGPAKGAQGNRSG